MNSSFSPGIQTLLERHTAWLEGRSIGVLTHRAAVDSRGVTTVERLLKADGVCVKCLFAPEHGFEGGAAAGEPQKHYTHPDWNIPVYSLYGESKKPDPEMMEGLDAVVCDLRDLGTRCYTYVSSLLYMLEAAASASVEFVVADRPVPLPRVVDGPVTEEEFRSFVSLADTPFCYGMTPGETALWYAGTLKPGISLRVAAMRGYSRNSKLREDTAQWERPSPGIKSHESALCYPATVFCEALPSMDYGAGTDRQFAVFAAPWADGNRLAEELSGLGLAGVRFTPCSYASGSTGGEVNGVHLEVTSRSRFRPVGTAVALIYCAQKLYGVERVWQDGNREFFDRLCGTASVRAGLENGDDPRTTASLWRKDVMRFKRERRKYLLY
ncbi:MAG: DUF1343 domain-containing protein [Kiritimatiellia bacterium]